MKANLPKTFNQLSKNEQDRLLAAMQEAVYDAKDEELCDAQIIWIKMDCIILHNAGRTVDEIISHIGAWKNMYRRNARFKSKQEQDAFLNPQLEAIFGDEGFPEEFVQSLKKIGR